MVFGIRLDKSRKQSIDVVSYQGTALFCRARQSRDELILAQEGCTW